MRFLTSADRHGIDRADAMRVARHPHIVVLLREEPLKEMRIGFDRRARAVEVVVVDIEGEEFLIHAMRLRRRYHHLLEGPR